MARKSAKNRFEGPFNSAFSQTARGPRGVCPPGTQQPRIGLKYLRSSNSKQLMHVLRRVRPRVHYVVETPRAVQSKPLRNLANLLRPKSGLSVDVADLRSSK